jgi:hypothetical protein
MSTAKYNLNIQSGETVNRQFQWISATGAPFDLTGYTLDSHIRTEYRAPTASAQFTATSPDPTNGYFSLQLSASSSAALTGSCYWYDVRATSGSSVAYPLEGKLTVSPRVTR